MATIKKHYIVRVLDPDGLRIYGAYPHATRMGAFFDCFEMLTLSMFRYYSTLGIDKPQPLEIVESDTMQSILSVQFIELKSFLQKSESDTAKLQCVIRMERRSKNE